MNTKTPPNVGDRLVVHGLNNFVSIVRSVEWNKLTYDWQINLDWGIHGQSRVWLHDEDTVWFRYSASN